MPSVVSYAQRYEDLYLLRCFGSRRDGFYIDIGLGHPVYDNMSFAFYLQGWRHHGRAQPVALPPHPPCGRDRQLEVAVGAKSGETTFYLVDDFHGLSTAIESHAVAAQTQFGKRLAGDHRADDDAARAARQAPPAFDFLKVDVEGAEKERLQAPA